MTAAPVAGPRGLGKLLRRRLVAAERAGAAAN